MKKIRLNNGQSKVVKKSTIKWVEENTVIYG